MKEKILIFIIGVLLGALVATTGFYIYTLNNNSNSDNMQMNGGTPPEMPSGQNGQPPEKPDGEYGQPPEMPSDNN